MTEVHGKYNSAAPTVQDGSPVVLQTDVNGNLKIVSQGSTPGTSATSLGKAEDAAHVTGDVGVEILGVRNATGATLTSTEGDYSPIAVNALGAVYMEEGPFAYSRKTADGQVKAGAGFVHAISISGLTATPTAGLMTIYDSLTETGTVLYAEWVFATVVGHSIILDVPFATGLFVGFDATLANVQATVSYR